VAVSHGAVTIVNALAAGSGAALGVNLYTAACVRLTNKPKHFVARNLTNPTVDNKLVLASVRRVLRKFNGHSRYGAIVETRSNIPVAVGLKSSSAASNAVTLATIEALGQTPNDRDVIDLAVDASFDAGVTKTGGFDDALACYFGGLVVTNNLERRMLKRFKPDDGVKVLVIVPRAKRYTKNVDRRRLKGIKRIVLAAHREAFKGNYWFAMTLNGLAYSAVLRFGVHAVERALEAGAISAGLTGKGPSVAAIVPHARVKAVLAAWRNLSGSTIQTSVNFRKAHSWVRS